VTMAFEMHGVLRTGAIEAVQLGEKRRNGPIAWPIATCSSALHCVSCSCGLAKPFMTGVALTGWKEVNIFSYYLEAHRRV